METQDPFAALQEARRALAAMRFPKISHDPVLQDFKVYLADYAGYIAGIVSQIRPGSGRPRYPLLGTEELRARLEALQEQGAQAAAVHLVFEYLDQLDRVLSTARRVLLAQEGRAQPD